MDSSMLIERFIRNSSAAQAINITITADELQKTIPTLDAQFVNIEPPFDIWNVSTKITEKGIDKAIIQADLAIAETGTVVINSTSEDIRLATCLCEHLFVVIKASEILSTLEDAGDYLHENHLQNNAYTAFITGPSRTADIERVLTIGVHGPTAVTVYIVSDC